MIVHNCVQGEADWTLLRLGKVTASELDSIMTPEFKIRTGEGPKTFLLKKLAEAYRGQPVEGFSTWQTEEGQLLEDEARSWFALMTEHKVSNVGFCESDDHRSGCSPDALLDDDGGMELKCPQAVNHVRYLMDGVLPKDYAAQVHMSLYVTGRKWWKFVSYRRRFPAFVITVNRDEVICAKIGEALAAFDVQFTAGMERLQSL